jgi:hypothetical protein
MATAYWSSIAPKKGADREKLIEYCGPKCFLMPNKRKFPICRRCEPLDGCRCKPECSALRAAIIRGRQWGYNSVADRARQMHDAMGCEWPSTRRARVARRKVG